MRKSKIKPIIEQSFTNDKDQVINVGDACIIITMCTRSTNFNVGRYLGVRKDTSWGDKEGFRVCVEIDANHNVFRHKETGQDYPLGKEQALVSEKFPGVVEPKYPDYNLGNTFGMVEADRVRYWKERQAIIDKYQEDRKPFENAIKEIRAEYEWVKVPYKRRSQLYLNKIYSVNMLAKDFAGSNF